MSAQTLIIKVQYRFTRSRISPISSWLENSITWNYVHVFKVSFQILSRFLFLINTIFCYSCCSLIGNNFQLELVMQINWLVPLTVVQVYLKGISKQAITLFVIILVRDPCLRFILKLKKGAPFWVSLIIINPWSVSATSSKKLTLY